MSDGPRMTLCVCTHSPRLEMLERCLAALGAQVGVSSGMVETLLVDNGSSPALARPTVRVAGDEVRLVREDRLGLMHARLAALNAARAPFLLFVDDDNFLRPNYLTEALDLIARYPRLGAAGGRLVGLPESTPPPWFDTVADDLLTRDHGPDSFEFRSGSPSGGGMLVRREAFLDAARIPFLLVGRRGGRLLAGEDTELCLRIQRLGWEVRYEPGLVLDHFLETRRLNLPYLERMNEGFGIARPYLELYGDGRLPWRRLHSLRRARFERRRARELRSAAAAEAEGALAQVRARLDAAFSEGVAFGLRQLAFGPPVWSRIGRAFGDAASGWVG